MPFGPTRSLANHASTANCFCAAPAGQKSVRRPASLLLITPAELFGRAFKPSRSPL
jgi:hypothetical protein